MDIQGGKVQASVHRQQSKGKRAKIVNCLFVLLLCLILSPAHPGNAQTALTISQDQVVADYPKKLTFQITVESTSTVQSIKLIYSTNVQSCQPAVAYQELDFTPASKVSAEWDLDFIITGIIPPGALLTYQWQVTDGAGNSLLSEEKTYLVTDERYTWQSLSSGPVTLQWYRGTAAFGQDLLDISLEALERLAEQAGITPPSRIWISIYPDSEAVQEVVAHSSEWAGAVAFPDYQSIVAGIAPGELDWAADVLPHELAHITTDALVFNCRGVWLPTWLSEGLAVVAEGDIPETYHTMVLSALQAEELPPLRTLARGFSPYSDEAVRSYGQSGMIVEYMLDQYGPTRMADLLVAIQSGLIPDDALLEVYNLDTDGLDAAWRVSLGFQPQPTQAALNTTATQIPTLALWTAVIQPSATPSPSATITQTPTGTATPEPTRPDSISSPEPTPTPPAGSPGKLPILLWVGIPIGIGLLLGILWIIVRHSRRKT